MRGSYYSPIFRMKKPQLNLDELKVQIALGTIPPKCIRTQVHDPEILDKLANLPDDEVRAIIAIHPNAAVKTLVRLAKGPNIPRVTLIAIVARPELPVEMLYRLSKHKDFRVREEAKGVLFIRSKGSIDIQDD